MNAVELIKKVDDEIPELEEVQKFIDYALDYLKLDKVVFNVIIIDNDEIHALNKEYRGVDRPTDVISFALEDDDTFIPLEERILGDIYISIDKAKEQASAYGHSLLRELCRRRKRNVYTSRKGFRELWNQKIKLLLIKIMIILKEISVSKLSLMFANIRWKGISIFIVMKEALFSI